MLLHKPQVYRHLLLNRMKSDERRIQPRVIRFAILLILFEVYIKWFHLERYCTEHDLLFITRPLIHQYLVILSLCILESIVYYLSIFLAVYCYRRRPISYNFIATALIISSFGKMLLILIVIWDYHQLEYSWLVSLIVLGSNTEALSVYLQAPYLHALIMVIFGTACRILTQVVFLYMAHIEPYPSQPHPFGLGWLLFAGR